MLFKTDSMVILMTPVEDIGFKLTNEQSPSAKCKNSAENLKMYFTINVMQAKSLFQIQNANLPLVLFWIFEPTSEQLISHCKK